MTLEDPFFVVKDEVCKALNKTRGLFARWTELQSVLASGGGIGVATGPSVASTPGIYHHHHHIPGLGSVPATPSLGLPIILNPREELEWTTTELRNSLRSIEWDLEDLDDTIAIVEKNPSKFKLDNKELTIRRNFVEQTREEIKVMKDKMNISKGRDRDRTARQPLLDNSPARVPQVSHGTAKYSKLENEMDSPNRQFLDGVICNQSSMMRHQDEHLDIMSDNTGTLKTVSRPINSEYDEQQVMLDDFNNEMEIVTDSKLDATMKKMAKVLHMSNDRRQWVVIGVLTAVLLVLVVLFVL